MHLVCYFWYMKIFFFNPQTSSFFILLSPIYPVITLVECLLEFYLEVMQYYLLFTCIIKYDFLLYKWVSNLPVRFSFTFFNPDTQYLHISKFKTISFRLDSSYNIVGHPTSIFCSNNNNDNSPDLAYTDLFYSPCSQRIGLLNVNSLTITFKNFFF